MRHFKRLFLAINLIVLCCLEADGASKYYDGENKPYEFGFNIEGEQHRHEKKDENGLIMGEFGFITADGVYHVTVYATDENGNFKIVSMKNIRVKPYPSGPNAAKKGASPERKGNSLPFPPGNSQSVPQTKTVSQAQPVPQAHPVSHAQPVAQRPQQPQLQKPIASPAKTCSHCSLPTTTTQAPKKQDFPASNYNTPAQNAQYQPNNNQLPEKSRPGVPGQGPQIPASKLPSYNTQQGSVPQTQPNYGGQTRPSAPSDGNEQNYPAPGLSQQGGSPQSGLKTRPNYPQQGLNGQNYPNQDLGAPLLKPGQPYSNLNTPPGSATGARNPKQYAQNNAQEDQPYNPQDGFSGTLSSPLGPNKPTLVSANMQRVDKNTDVNRRGPGEKEGLPDKLDRNDMMLLLYTFNYTLGFHAHHEEGYTNGAKKGYYYVTARNGIRTRVDYVADETGFHPKITQEVFDTLSEEVPKEETEKDEKYGLKGYEFKWIYYPVNTSR